MDEITDRIRRAFVAADGSRADGPEGPRADGLILADKPAGPSSFAIVGGVRADRGEDRACGNLDPFARDCSSAVRPGDKLAGSFVGARQAVCHGRRLRPYNHRRPRGESSTIAASGDGGARRRLERLRGEIELPIPAASAVKIEGERAYRLHRRGVAVEMPLRRSQVHALDVIAYTDGVVRLDLLVSSGTYVRAIAEALGGHCTTLRRLGGGPVQRRGRRREAGHPGRGGAGAAAMSRRAAVRVAIGTFDGVHLGHRRVIEAALATGLPVRVITFHPHPRVVLGNSSS